MCNILNVKGSKRLSLRWQIQLKYAPNIKEKKATMHFSAAQLIAAIQVEKI